MLFVFIMGIEPTRAPPIIICSEFKYLPSSGFRKHRLTHFDGGVCINRNPLIFFLISVLRVNDFLRKAYDEML